MTPVPVKFGPKGTHPQQEGCAFHVSHAEQKVLMCLNLVTFLSWSWCVAIVTTSNVFTLYRLYFNKTRIDYDRRLVADLDGIEPAYAP